MHECPILHTLQGLNLKHEWPKIDSATTDMEHE